MLPSHTNPQHFPNPENFDPTRFEGNGPAPYTFVPFGPGPRMYPRNEYARTFFDLKFLVSRVKEN